MPFAPSSAFGCFSVSEAEDGFTTKTPCERHVSHSRSQVSRFPGSISDDFSILQWSLGLFLEQPQSAKYDPVRTVCLIFTQASARIVCFCVNQLASNDRNPYFSAKTWTPVWVRCLVIIYYTVLLYTHVTRHSTTATCLWRPKASENEASSWMSSAPAAFRHWPQWGFLCSAVLRGVWTWTWEWEVSPHPSLGYSV